MRKTLLGVMAVLFSVSGTLAAAEGGGPEKPAAPPLPLHSVEGTGGSFVVHSAYLVNPPEEGKVFGKPSFGGIHVHMGHGRSIYSLTATETLWGRLELGYGLNHLHVGDLGPDIAAATGMVIRDDTVDMHNFNARVLLVGEGAFEQSWMPALTFGVHYKYNETVDNLDRDLAGTLSAIGIEDNEGWDFTLYASKMIASLGRPVIFTAGLRSTEAAHIGLLGFTGEREIVGEGSVCVLVTDRWLLAGEYRQKPDEYTSIPGLVDPEDDWWTFCTAYIVDEHMTLAGGYAHFGRVLNHKANGAWGIALKYEF